MNAHRKHSSCVSLARALAGVLIAWAFVVAAIGAPRATAVEPTPHWSIISQAEPTYFKPGDTADAYRLIVRNNGGAATLLGSPIVIHDTLPPHVAATKITAHGEGSANWNRFLTCIVASVECTYQDSSTTGIMPAGDTIVVTITVAVENGVAPSLQNSASVFGGGAPSATSTESTAVSEMPVPFSLAYFASEATEVNGEPDTQAGSHPFDFVSAFAFNIAAREPGHPFEFPLTTSALRDLEVELPPGLVGDPLAVPRCSQQAFLVLEKTNCPVATQVGTVKPFFYGAFASHVFPVFNIVPPPGQPAELGFTIAGIGHVPMFFHVRSDGDYGLTAQVTDMSSAGLLQGAIFTLWGVPAERIHDLERTGTMGGVEGEAGGLSVCQPSIKLKAGKETQQGCSSGVPAAPFLTLPTSCTGGPLQIGAMFSTWQNSSLESASPTPQPLPAETGCEHVPFAPSIGVTPETTQAGGPSGYTIDVHVPQIADPTGLASAELRNAVLALPAGTVVSPSAADGLQACTDAQFETNAPSCPPASKLAVVTVTTPLLVSPLEGDLFLGAPGCAPCSPADAQAGHMISLFLVARGSGVTVKLHGSTSIDQATGQLTTTFDENPQLPFEDLNVTLNGGPRAPLANPAGCGTPVQASAELTPYSASAPTEIVSNPFEVTGCPQPHFAPSFSAGTTNNQAGSFSPESVTFSRSNQDEDLEGITVHTPPGLLGMLSNVQPCGEPAAQSGTCGPRSLIGKTTVGAGPGSPLYVGGNVFLTGPYKGAPFGLSIVVHALAGPFDLGNVIVRAAINVDPRTSALTITSDPLPQALDGIPLQIRTVNVDIDREGFIFNPTSCQAMAIDATLASTKGTIAAISSRFQAANCATLPFKPGFTVFTQGSTSRHSGASLDVKVGSSTGQANIAKVHVSLPKALPSRLETLKLACLASVFDANPAACPAGSNVGTATAVTPILTNPLTGPAYLVSHGGAAFPDLEIVLQGEGITLILDGKTNIKNGITTSSFDTVPDAPISSFELKLPEGPHSVLSAPGGNLCSQALIMPTAIQGQNGALIKQSTPIEVTSCPYALRIVHRSVKKRTLTLKVSVPQGGKLVATGKGLTRAAKSIKGRYTLTLTLKERRAGNLRTRVQLRFTPAKGKQRKVLRKSITVTFG